MSSTTAINSWEGGRRERGKYVGIKCGGLTYKRHLFLPTQIHIECVILPRPLSMWHCPPRTSTGDSRTLSYMESHQSEFSKLTSFILAQQGHHTTMCPTPHW